MKKILKPALCLVLCSCMLLSIGIQYNKERQTAGTYLSVSAATNGWVQSGGYWYYYVNGVKQTGWLQTGPIDWYYLRPSDGQMVTGWQTIGNFKFWFDSSGRMSLEQWREIGGKWYYFDANGHMKTGWFESKPGNWYYLSPSTGAAATGLWEISQRFYYFNPSGTTIGMMLTGTRTIGGNHYTFDADNGHMTTTGWMQFSGVWYYNKPSELKLANGWNKLPISNTSSTKKWYYFENCKMDTCKVLTIDTFYDQTVVNRFGSTSAANSKMWSYMNKTENTFFQVFDLRLLNVNMGQWNPSSSAVDWNTLVWDFAAGHRGTNIHSPVFWSCNTKFGGTSFSVDETQNVFMVNPLNGYTDAQRTEEYQNRLMHELSHQLGTPDHYHDPDGKGGCNNLPYCSDCGEQGARSPNCILYSGVNSSDPNDMFCVGCATDIRNHIQNHH